MRRRFLLIWMVLLLLPACRCQSPAATPAPSEYRDNRLCVAVKVSEGWITDGVSGGFASFAPPTGPTSFRITNVALEEMTLAQALADLRRGPLGASIREVRDWTVDGRPALWITFAPDAEFQFVVLVIAPDCGDGPHALFISATGTDQNSFETFISSIRFLNSE